MVAVEGNADLTKIIKSNYSSSHSICSARSTWSGGRSSCRGWWG